MALRSRLRSANIIVRVEADHLEQVDAVLGAQSDLRRIADQFLIFRLLGIDLHRYNETGRAEHDARPFLDLCFGVWTPIGGQCSAPIDNESMTLQMPSGGLGAWPLVGP